MIFFLIYDKIKEKEMSFFDNIKDKLTASFSDWIKINDNKSGFTIEDFPYATGVDEELTNPQCALCVSVNNCYFKNEEDKTQKLFCELSESNFTPAPASPPGLPRRSWKSSIPIGRSMWWIPWGLPPAMGC